MKKLLWVGSPFFSNLLPSLGWDEVYVHTFPAMTLFTYEELVAKAGFTPDVLVVADKSFPPFVLGVENFPCITVLYVVDSHLHSWYPYYAQAFDLCLVSLYDHIPNFLLGRHTQKTVCWSPPYAQDAFRPKDAEDPIYDCLFVGTVNANTPLRKVFLDELSAILPGLHVTQGNFVALFPKAKVVLNFCEYGDLNFRVFEALGLGSALVTPRIGNRQADLFSPEKHFLLYTHTDPRDAKNAIERLLSDAAKRRELGSAGLAEVDAHHRASHRARAFTEHVTALLSDRAHVIADRTAQAVGIRERYLKLLYLLWAKEIHNEALQERYLAFATGRTRL